jgi:hypothetical protein
VVQEHEAILPKSARGCPELADRRSAQRHLLGTIDRSLGRDDRILLERGGFSISSVRELPGFVEATLGKGEGKTLVQWTVDSAYRFFPLVRDDTLGLALHPFDLATNKVLALVGRLEARDWIDVIGCHTRLQELGSLL